MRPSQAPSSKWACCCCAAGTLSRLLLILDTRRSWTPITSKCTCFWRRPITGSDTKKPPNWRTRSATRCTTTARSCWRPENSTSGCRAYVRIREDCRQWTSIVAGSNPGGMSVHTDIPALLRIIWSEQKRSKEHDRRCDGEQPVRVDIRQGRCLRLDHVVEPVSCLMLSGRQAQTSLVKLACKAPNSRL